MKFFFVVVALILSALGFVSSAYSEVASGKLEADKPSAGRSLSSDLLFTIAGSNTVGARLAPAWAKAFLEHKGATNVSITKLQQANEYRVRGEYQYLPVFIDIRAHGSSTGFKALKAGSADMAMSSRPIKLKELASLKQYGDLHSFSAEHVVAIDGLAVIVHPSNPLSSLNVNTIAKIFSGEIRNWQAVGGRDQAIRVLARDNNSGTWDTFKSLVLAKRHALYEEAERFESNDELSDSVSDDTSAIGFVGLASVREAKPLGVYDGQALPLKPEPLFVATEDYPLARRLYLYTPENSTNGYVKEFVRFAKGVEGQKQVQTVGFVSQNPVRVSVKETSTGPARYQTLVTNGDRLSVNFRFKPGSADLDNKAKQDVRRLAKYFNQPDQKAVKVQLIGFSNQEKTKSTAQVLSKLRAIAVKMELFRYGISVEPVEAFGSEVLVADRANLNAKSKNDRVEVWVIPYTKKPQTRNISTGNVDGDAYAYALK